MKDLLHRPYIDRVLNLVIFLLVCSSLFLAGKTGMLRGFLPATQAAGPSTLAELQDTPLSRETPVGLLLQLPQGRYGVQYDQAAVDRLYTGGLGHLLTESLVAMEEPKTSDRAAWIQATEQAEAWVCYSFPYNVTFSDQGQQGRHFLLTFRGDKVDGLLFYNEELGNFSTCKVKEGLAMPDLCRDLTETGGAFAFEEGGREDCTDGAALMFLLPGAPSCPAYTAENPIAMLSGEGRDALLEELDFNPRAAAIYQSLEGTVIQEGADTLRIQKDGTLVFHGSQSGLPRYQALSARETDLQIKAEEILNKVKGDGTLCCQSIETAPDGTTELTFCYLLSGARVHLADQGWSARFVFQGSGLTAFQITLRSYTATDEPCALLPAPQALAAAETMGQGREELWVNYQDNGSGHVTATWVVREGE